MLTNMCFDVVRLGSTSVHSWSHHGSELKESHIGEFIVALMEPSAVRWQNIPPPPCRPPGSRAYMEQTEITMMSVRLCVSLVFLWTRILHSVKSRRTQRMVCLLCWGRYKLALGWKRLSPWHFSCHTPFREPCQNSACVPSWASSRQRCPLLWTLRCASPHLLSQKSVLSDFCIRPYQQLSSCPTWKVELIAITSLKREICTELIHD